MNKLDIRAAHSDDFVDIARIWVQGWLATLKGHDRAPPDNLFETLRARIPRELEAGWELSVAVLDGRVVGMMALFPAEPRLDQLFVEETLRSHGIGKRLLEHAKARMPGGYQLRTHSLNTNAQRFYAREGMRHLRDEPHPRHPEELFSVFEWRPDSRIRHGRA